MRSLLVSAQSGLVVRHLSCLHSSLKLSYIAGCLLGTGRKRDFQIRNRCGFAYLPDALIRCLLKSAHSFAPSLNG
jgi:hypothetical protein